MAKKELSKIERELILEHIHNEMRRRLDDELYQLYRYIVKSPKVYDLVEIHYKRKQIITESEEALSKMTDVQLSNMYTFLDESELIRGLFDFA